MRSVKVSKKDITKIGFSVFKEDGDKLSIVCCYKTCNIEEILLRSILKCFGKYEIIGEEEYEETLADGSKVLNIVFRTNLPFETYMKIK